MTEREWEKFFELLQKILNLPGMSWKEKADLVRSEASSQGAETSLDEFANWFDSSNQ